MEYYICKIYNTKNYIINFLHNTYNNVYNYTYNYLYDIDYNELLFLQHYNRMQMYKLQNKRLELNIIKKHNKIEKEYIELQNRFENLMKIEEKYDDEDEYENDDDKNDDDDENNGDKILVCN